MPILIQPTSTGKRRPWLWALFGVPMFVLSLLGGLVAWSWRHPVELRVERFSFAFGYDPPGDYNYVTGGWYYPWLFSCPVPLEVGGGTYVLALHRW